MAIGPRMKQVAWIVRNNPGITPMDAADAVGPHGSRMYGYRTVDRAIRAGLVERRERTDKRGCYRLYPAD